MGENDNIVCLNKISIEDESEKADLLFSLWYNISFFKENKYL